jgi:carbamoyltransferase
VLAIQKERLTRQKHHWGKIDDFRKAYVSQLRDLNKPVDVLVECYSSDDEVKNLSAYEQELAETLNFAPDCRRARISHHLSHVYSVFHPSPFENAAVMIIDGQGSPVSDFTEKWPGEGSVPGDWREVSSFKQLWDRNEKRLVGLGMFYFLLTQAIFRGEGNEGKVMGLAPYGDPEALGLPPLEVNGPQVTIPHRWMEILRDRGRFRYAGDDRSRFNDIANLSAAGQPRIRGGRARSRPLASP